MHWSGWIVTVLVVVNAGFMTFDGMRALTVGDYITPTSGEHAGQLGPWSKVVRAIGIEPRSSAMKFAFVVYGMAFLIVLIAFLLKAGWAWTAMLVVAALGLWYIPFGLVINLIVIVLLLVTPLRAG
jgi:hypothetical protein